jgi:hypothetical protein
VTFPEFGILYSFRGFSAASGFCAGSGALVRMRAGKAQCPTCGKRLRSTIFSRVPTHKKPAGATTRRKASQVSNP